MMGPGSPPGPGALRGTAAGRWIAAICRSDANQGASPLEIPARWLPWSSKSVSPSRARGFKNSESLHHRLAAAGRLPPTHQTDGHCMENKNPCDGSHSGLTDGFFGTEESQDRMFDDGAEFETDGRQIRRQSFGELAGRGDGL